MITDTPLKQSLRINGQAVCDCGHLEFEVGMIADTRNGNNFIRLLECTKCRKQMQIVHHSNIDLRPAVGG